MDFSESEDHALLREAVAKVARGFGHEYFQEKARTDGRTDDARRKYIASTEDYLRGQVGYRGVIVSDDLEMGAIGALCPIGEATVRTAAAGHDLLLVCGVSEGSLSRSIHDEFVKKLDGQLCHG